MTKRRNPGRLVPDPAPLKECCVACGRYVREFSGSWRRNWAGGKEFICNDCKEASNGCKEKEKIAAASQV